VDWTKVVTDPVGLAGFALFLVHALVKTFAPKTRRDKNHWLLPAAFALSALCMFAGFGLACWREFKRSEVKSQSAPTPKKTLRIGKVDQKVNSGAAVAGVQGNVTVTPPLPPSKKK
jgi:hypothetical protein